MLLVEIGSGRIIRANNAASHFYGISKMDLEVMNICDLSCETPDCILAELQRTRLNKFNHFLSKHKPAVRQIRSVEVFSSLVKFEGEELVNLMIHDITDQIMAEEALKQSEKRYRTIVEDMVEFVCRFKPDMSLTFVNQAYCRFCARTPYDLIGKSAFSAITEPFRQSVRERIESLILDPRNLVGIEVEVRSPEGELRWQRWLHHPILNSFGEVKEFQAIGWDITDEKIAEQKLERRLRELTLLHELAAASVNRSMRIT